MADLEYQYGGETISYSRARGGFVWQGSSRAFETPEKAEASIDRANGEAKDDAPKFEKRKAIRSPAVLAAMGLQRVTLYKEREENDV